MQAASAVPPVIPMSNSRLSRTCDNQLRLREASTARVHRSLEGTVGLSNVASEPSDEVRAEPARASLRRSASNHADGTKSKSDKDPVATPGQFKRPSPCSTCPNGNCEIRRGFSRSQCFACLNDPARRRRGFQPLGVSKEARS